MKLMKSKQEIWGIEMHSMKKLEIWDGFALEAYNLAKDIVDHAHEMNYYCMKSKFVRLLMAICLENLIKGRLVNGSNSGKYLKGNKLTFGSNGHDLLYLLSELHVIMQDRWKVYVNSWAISGTWFGKYPFPLDMNGVVPEYASMKSSKALTKRRLSGKRRLGEKDVLHSGVGDLEWKYFDEVINSIKT